jgi:quinol monooxygenase YgiN
MRERSSRHFPETRSRLPHGAGCLQYIVHRHHHDAARFFLYEQYLDEAALQSHRDSPHFQEYAIKALAGIGERQQGDLYQPLTGD